jgi:hypothetical protein
MEKEILKNKIKEWVQIDNEIRTLSAEQKKRQLEKAEISKQLMETMRNNEIDCFNLSDGELVYSTKSKAKPITKKHLLNILYKLCNGNGEKAEEMNEFIMSNREEITTEQLVRKIKKNT